MISWHIKNYDDLSKKELYSILQFRISIFMIEQQSIYEDSQSFSGVIFACRSDLFTSR